MLFVNDEWKEQIHIRRVVLLFIILVNWTTDAYYLLLFVRRITLNH